MQGSRRPARRRRKCGQGNLEQVSPKKVETVALSGSRNGQQIPDASGGLNNAGGLDSYCAEQELEELLSEQLLRFESEAQSNGVVTDRHSQVSLLSFREVLEAQYKYMNSILHWRLDLAEEETVHAEGNKAAALLERGRTCSMLALDELELTLRSSNHDRDLQTAIVQELESAIVTKEEQTHTAVNQGQVMMEIKLESSICKVRELEGLLADSEAAEQKLIADQLELESTNRRMLELEALLAERGASEARLSAELEDKVVAENKLAELTAQNKALEALVVITKAELAAAALQLKSQPPVKPVARKESRIPGPKRMSTKAKSEVNLKVEDHEGEPVLESSAAGDAGAAPELGRVDRYLQEEESKRAKNKVPASDVQGGGQAELIGLRAQLASSGDIIQEQVKKLVRMGRAAEESSAANRKLQVKLLELRTEKLATQQLMSRLKDELESAHNTIELFRHAPCTPIPTPRLEEISELCEEQPISSLSADSFRASELAPNFKMISSDMLTQAFPKRNESEQQRFEELSPNAKEQEMQQEAMAIAQKFREEKLEEAKRYLQYGICDLETDDTAEILDPNEDELKAVQGLEGLFIGDAAAADEVADELSRTFK